jgi:hypothetical protein
MHKLCQPQPPLSTAITVQAVLCCAGPGTCNFNILAASCASAPWVCADTLTTSTMHGGVKAQYELEQVLSSLLQDYRGT